jgi:beta-galactosidase
MAKLILSMVALFLTSTVGAFSQNPAGKRENFCDNWKFHLGDVLMAENKDFDDTGWRLLNLPHDWSIEGTFDRNNPATAGGGALPGGIGWYRKTFEVPQSAEDHMVFIDFDGVYRNSEVWINGHYLGKRPNGYISFRYDLTPYIKYGTVKNTLAVRVDNSQQPNSRWYSGSGIYRNVWLVTVNKIHLDHWGNYLTTPDIDDKRSTVEVLSKVRNSSTDETEVEVRISILDASMKEVSHTASLLKVPANDSRELSQQLEISDPVLWSVKQPYLYQVITRIAKNGKVIDETVLPLGIRYFRFDAEKGFTLNGKPMKIYGVCNHHDLGALGAAVNKRALQRQLEILKEMGCNGIRTSHNPPAPELLDLCDRMGFIVIDEAFDMWKKPKNRFDYHLDWDAWHEQDLRDQVLRDRNHPSVFVWSIGNEVPEQSFHSRGSKVPDDSSGIVIARELAGIVKQLDATRPVTFGADQVQGESNAVLQSGAIDIIGYNYRHPFWKDVHAKWGMKPFIATESASAFESRGDYSMPSDVILRAGAGNRNLRADYTASSYDNYSAAWGSTHEESLKEFFRLDYMAGTFIWTGWDYLGEPTPYPWPARSSYFGVIDLAGFPKDGYYLYQSVWTDKPMLHIFPHWNWNKGDTVDIWAYYNQADEVELYLNGRSLGTKKKDGNDLHVIWRIVFEPGTLKAVSRKSGKQVLIKEIKTAGAPARIMLQADRTMLNGDGQDLSFVKVSITDASGNLVPDADNQVDFSLEGEGYIAGVDNGFQAGHQSLKAHGIKAYNGMCLVIIGSAKKSGKVMLTANAEGLMPDTIEIEVNRQDQ